MPIMCIGAMVWKTGNIVDFYGQVELFGKIGLDGIAFHTAPVLTGEWASFDVRKATEADLRWLKDAVEGFREVSVHAEFDNYDVVLCSPNEIVRQASVESLREGLKLAAYLDARVVTVHEGMSRTGAPAEVLRQALKRSVHELAELAGEHGVIVGFELTHDYDMVLDAEGPVGITLDVGHVCFDDGAGYREFGSIRGLILHLGEKLVHVHVHDYDGRYDHKPIGDGHIDWEEVIGSLCEIGYHGMLCLELSPLHATVDHYVKSAARLRELIAAQCR
jgi:sugar phosphate isomerase/epimerase